MGHLSRRRFLDVLRLISLQLTALTLLSTTTFLHELAS